MKIFHKTTNFSPTAQQSKLNTKWLLSFCLICLLSLSSNSLLAVPITFTFDGSESGQSTITKTVSGVTMTLSNEQPDNNFGNLFGSALIFYGVTTGPTVIMTGCDINFSSNVQILSYTVNTAMGLDGGESLTFTDGISTSVENTPFVAGIRNFSNQFNVLANTTVSLTSNFGANTVQNEFISFDSITVDATLPPASIPTLSEWGLIILALSFMTLGTLYLLQPKFRGSFEQEG